MMTTNSANDSVAAQLSYAAYTPLTTYQAGGIPPQGLPADWTPLRTQPYSNYGSYSDGSPDTNNQFITFFNAQTNQVMMVFKGTDNIPNAVSDIANSGGQAWDSIQANAQAALMEIRRNYPNAQVMTDGHSLGGGMAQTFALANNLSGYGQNALPISSSALNGLAPDGTTLSSKLPAWNASGNSFSEVNTAGDPATNYYSTLQGQTYLDSNPTTLANPWVQGEVAGGLLSPFIPWLGAAITAASAFETHSIDTVISLLNSSPTTTTNANGTTTQYGDGSTSTTINHADGTSTVSTTYAGGNTSDITYDANGSPINVSARTVNVDGTYSATSADTATGTTIRENYDTNQQLLSRSTLDTTTNSGSTQTYTNGALTSQTDFGSGSSTTVHYDPVTHLQTGTDSVNVDGSRSISRIDANGNKTTTTEYPDGRISTEANNYNGSTLTTIGADGTTEVITHSLWSNETTDAISYPDGSGTTTVSQNGNITSASTINADGSGSRTQYNPDGSGTVTGYQPDGSSTTVTFNPDGSLVQNIDTKADGTQTTTTYGPNSTIASTLVIGADGSNTATSYSPSGSPQRQTVTGADGSTSDTLYNANGSPSYKQFRNADGSYGEISYNADGTNGTVRVCGSDGTRSESGTNADGTTYARVVNTDGSSYADSYYPDGSVASHEVINADGSGSTESYTKSGALRSRLVVNSDGTSYSDNYTYYPDGAMASEAHTYTDRSRSSKDYFADGTVSADSTTAADGSNLSHTYYASGAIFNTIVTNADGSGESTTYFETGALDQTATWAGSGRSPYYVDPVAKSITTQNPDGSITVDNFNARGTLISALTSYADGSKTTQSFYANGKLAAVTCDAAPGAVLPTAGAWATSVTASSHLRNFVTIDGNSVYNTAYHYKYFVGYASVYAASYDSNGQMTSLSLTLTDGATENITYGIAASETYVAADGSKTALTFFYNGQPQTQSIINADGSHYTTNFYSNGHQSSFVGHYPDGSDCSMSFFSNGVMASYSQTGKPDGSSVYITGKEDGSQVTTSYSADGSYVVDVGNGHGDSTQTYYAADGSKLRDTWVRANGTSGSDTFYANGTSDSIINTYAAYGRKISDKWSKADGSFGTDSINSDGTGSGMIAWANGNSYNYINRKLFNGGGGEGGSRVGNSLEGFDAAYSYHFNGAGNIEIVESANSPSNLLTFASGVSLNNLTVSAAIGSNGKPALQIDTGNGQILTIDGGLDGTQQFQFADGNICTMAQLMAWARTTPVTVAGSNGNLIFSAKGNETLLAGSGNDIVYAWNGHNTLVAGAGVATLVGGSGNDTFVVNNSADIVQAHFSGNTVQSSVSYSLADKATTVQNLTLTGTADLTAVGNSLDNVITANSGNDVLIAGTGNSTLIGGAGQDTFIVGNGNCTIIDTVKSAGDILQFSIDMERIVKFSLQGADLLVKYASGSTLVKDYAPNGMLGSRSISKFQFVNGVQGEFSADGLGNSVMKAYDSFGALVASYWSHADGAYGNDLYNSDGSPISSTSYNADGSYGVYTKTAFYDSTNYYDANGYSIGYDYSQYSNGRKLNSSWWRKNSGTYGWATFNVDGSSTGTAYNADSSYSNYVNDGHGTVTTQYFDASGNLQSYSVQIGDGHGNETTTNYDVAGHVLGSVIASDDGLGNTCSTRFDASGTKLSDIWTKADGSHGSDTFNADGSSSGTTSNVNGSYSIYSNDGRGSIVTRNFDATGVLLDSITMFDDGAGNVSATRSDVNGIKISGTWCKVDGSYGNDTFHADGSSVGTAHAVDGSYSSYVNDGFGNVTTTNFDANGINIGNAWAKSDGTHGTNVFNPDGSSSCTSYNADGSHSSYSLDTAGNATSSNYDSSGRLIGDNWVKADGSTGSDTFNSDGSHASYTIDAAGTATSTNYDANGHLTSDNWSKADGSRGSDTYALDGSHTSYTIDAVGTATSGNYDTAGHITSDYWIKTDGSQGSDNYNLDGSHSSYSIAATGTATSGNYDGSGHLLNDYWVKTDGTTGGDTYTYNADGSTLQQWTQSNGSSGTVLTASSGNILGDSWALADGSQGVDAGGNHLFVGSTVSDNIVAASGNNILIGGAGNDTITTGIGADIIAFNRGDGMDIVNASIGSDNTISLGKGIAYSDIALSKVNNDLILEVGAGEQITLANWYNTTANYKSVIDLQVMADAMAAFDKTSADPLLNQAVQNFDFTAIVNAFDQANGGSATYLHWNATNSLLAAHLSGSDITAIGGDLAHQYGTNGSLTGMSLTGAQTALNDPQFGAGAQTLHPLQGLQGGAATL